MHHGISQHFIRCHYLWLLCTHLLAYISQTVVNHFGANWNDADWLFFYYCIEMQVMYEATCCSGECICPHDRFRPRDGGLLFFCFVCQAEYLDYHSYTYTNSHSCVYTHPYINPDDPNAHSIADAYASCQRSICLTTGCGLGADAAECQ